MSDKKQKLEKITSPTGVAAFPWLNKPDTKYNADGEYRVRLVLPKKDKEVKAFIESLDEAHEKAVEVMRKRVAEDKGAAAAKKMKIADAPYKDEDDKDTGKPTGNVVVNFKMKALVKSKKTGEEFEQRPTIFDAKGNQVDPCPRIGSGSKIKVSAFVVPFYTAQVGAGISLRLRGVKIIDLVEFGGGDASSHGFGDEEDGYEAPSKPAASKKSAKSKGRDEDTEDSEEAEDF